ncbi:MAG: hypothetical protein AAF694_08595 [Bacteroidota bacterium]
MVAEAEQSFAPRSYELRAKLASHINPLASSGVYLQDAIMQCTRKAIGEIDSSGLT